MRVLVTGGAGYIGSHTAKVLAGSGFEPVVLDNLSAGHRSAVRWGPLIEGDLSETSLVRTVLREHNIKAIIHFAAHAYVGESVREPRRYFRNNVANALNLLDAMLDADVQHIVFSSTCATYGLPSDLPIVEDHDQRPINPYGESKLFVERALQWYGEAYDLDWVTFRYFNAAGADPEGEIGEDHDPETHLVPLTIQSALNEIPYLPVHGTDYPTPDGTAIRDFIHVTDLARAHVLALQHLLDGGESTALNLGTGQGHSVFDVIQAVRRVSGRNVAVRKGPRRKGDPAVLVADPTEAQRVLGWEPQYPELETIVETAWRWYARNTTPSEATRRATAALGASAG